MQNVPAIKPQPSPRNPPPLWFWGLLLLLLYALAYALGVWLSGSALPLSGRGGGAAQGYADGRSWLGIPNAADTLSNLPFALMGAWAAWLWRRTAPGVLREGLGLLALGLFAIALGSGLYHWAPGRWTLVADRAGMALAFSGLIGLGTADRLDPGLARWLLRLLPPLALLAAALPALTGNVLPWALIQYGGMAWVLAMALRRPLSGGAGLPLGAVLLAYALAKVCEGLDAWVFEATGQWVSGHTLKHLVAAAALGPVLLTIQAAQGLIGRAGAR